MTIGEMIKKLKSVEGLEKSLREEMMLDPFDPDDDPFYNMPMDCITEMYFEYEETGKVTLFN